jgi:hypothetical protein
MRVRILFRRLSVSGPSGMSDAKNAIDGFFRERLLQIGQFAHASADLDFLALHDGHAGGVIAPIFKLG